MSRRIDTSLATIQFQVNARQANAAMQALQNMSDDLNSSIDKVNRNIANLGKDVPKDNPQLLNYQNQLAGLQKDLKDVQKAQRDFLKGAKAADQLWQAAREGTIESLSFRSIKAGVNGLKKRQEGLSPGNAQDMKDWRIIKEVIDEADRVVKQAGADVQNVVQTIREGGKVSEQTMRQTISTLKELKGSVDETDADFRTYGNDLDFMEAKLQDFTDAQRRAKGEIVDANDARREMNKLTEEGAAAAQREAEEAERKIAALHGEREDLMAQREQIKQNIAATQEQIDKNHELIEEKHRELAADEHAHNVIQDANHAHIESLKMQAESERKLANEKSDAAETHRRAAELQAQTTEQLTEKVTELQGKLAELNAEPVKPKVDASEIEKLEAELARLKRELEGVRSYREAAEAKKEAAQQALGGKDIWENERYIKAREEDVAASQAAVKKLDDKWDAYWSKQEDNAKKFAEVLKKSLEDVTYEDFQKHITGPNAELAKSWYRKTTRDNEGLEIWTDDNQKGRDIRYFRDNKKLGLATPEQLEELKLLEGLKRKWDEYWKARDKAEGDRSRSNAVFDELDKYKTESIQADVAIEAATKKAVEIKQQIVEKEKQIAAAQAQGTQATKNEVEAVKELIKMRERINELHQKKDSMSGIMPTAGIDKELNELMPKYEAGMKGLSEESRKLVREFTEAKRDLADIIKDEKEADEALKQFGITTADVADDLKLQAAAEKALKIEEESRLELAKQMLEVRKQIGAESLKDSRIVGSKKDQDFYKKNKDILDDEYWKGEAGGGSVGRMYKYLNDIADDSEAKAEFQEQVGVSVKDAMRVAAQRMREVLQEAMKRGIKVDDALSSFEDGYGQGPATHIHEFFKEFNEEIDNKEEELIRKRRRKLDAILDVVEDPGDEAEMPSREERLKLAKSALKGVGEGHYGNDTPLAESRRQQEEEVTRLDAKVKEFINTQEQSNKKSEEELRLKGELETAQGKLAESKKRENEEQQEYVKLQGEAIEQGNKAAKMETKLADAQSEATQRQADFNQKQQKGLDNINQMAQGNKALQTTLEGQEQQLKDNSDAARKNAEDTTAAEQQKQQARQLSIKTMEDMLAKLKEEYYTEELTAKERKEHIKDIQELEKAISTEKAKPALQMMTERMEDLGSLSTSALQETKKFWETMAQGADKGSDSLKEAEAHLKTITEEEQKRNLTAMKSSSDRLSGNIGLMSQGDIRQAIEDAKKYQLTLGSTSEEAKKLAQAIVNAEEHLKRYGVEAERAARKQEEDNKKAERAARDKEEVEAKAQQDQLRMMRERIVFEKQRQSLSADALTETKKYWEAVARGANEGSWAQKNALTMMERITAEEERRAKKKNVEKADRLIGTRYLTLSESELRESIEAARELQKTLSPTESLYKSLSKQIAIAEEHIKKYGVEAQRVAVREAQEAREAKQAFEDAVAGKFDKASMEELDEVIKKIKEYQATIKDPTGSGAQAFGDAKVQIDALSGRLNALKGVAEKVTGTFASADEVLARWAEHMDASKTASESMAQTLDEKLAGATSSFDEDIKQAAEDVDYWNKRIQEETQELAEMEAELEKLEKKHANSSWFRKHTNAYRREAWRIEILRNKIEKPETLDDGTPYISGKKGDMEWLKQDKQDAQERLAQLKKQKAEELGLTESEVQGEEKKADAKRLTNEQMQQGIKLLEEEYAKTDHTTEEGIKKRQQLREAIDQMNQELKESTGEWMSVADAMKLAGQAEKNTFLDNDGTGFTASAQDIQKATQALERQRDALLQTIKAKRDNKNLTKEEKAALDQEEAELQDLTNKLKALKFEQDNFNMSQAKMQELMRTPTNAVSLDELRAAIKRADGELKRMEGSLGQNNAQYKAFAEQVRNAKNQLKEMEGQAKASATAWEKAWSRLKTYVVMYMGFNAVWQKMVGTFSDILELSDKLGEVRKTTGFTADEVGRLSDNLSKIDTRTPLNELLSLSVAAGQLGLKTQEDVQGFTEAANKLMVALPEMGKEAATEMMKVALATGEVKRIQEQMDEGLVEGSSATAVAIEKIGSTIDRLRASSAASAPQITDFVKRVGAVGAQSGITIDQVAALGSTVDALGMRVEMSATALSRMIPAIKRNAFEVAKAIGMAPNALRQMFDEAGGGMNAMLAIFQHIKDSGMNANDIEQMLGMGGMADIMKDLNQQGARAGIVFAGLSQNVDVLREHLGIARTAYEENTAIQAEYDRMNETSAAKWERLKNTIEEMFVGDRSQKFFGFIIDGLRYIVDLINGPLQGAFQATIVSVGLIKTGLTGVFGEFGNAWNYLKDSAAAAEKALQEAANATNKISEATSGVEEAADVVGDIGEALEGAQEAGEQAGEAVGAATGAIEGMSGAAKVSIFSINGLKTAWKGLDATMKANIIVMVIALLYTLGKAIYDMVTETTKANKALGEANALIAIAIDRFEGYWAKLKETKTALDEATKSTEGLKEGSEDLAKATGEVVKAKEAHKSAMAEMNGLYGKYLGFMLTEANYANLNAAAHDKVTAAIRREMLAKQQQAAIDNVVQENMEDMKDGLANLSEELREEGRLNNTQAGQAKIAMQNFMRENFTADGDEIQIAEGAYKFLQQKGGNMGKLKKLDANQIAAAWYYEYLKDTFHLDEASLADITGVFPQGGSYRNTNVGGRHFRGDYAQAYFDNMQDVAEITSVFAGDMGAAEKEDRKSTTDLMKGFQAQIKKAESQINDKSLSEKERNAAYEDLANSLEGLDANIGLLDPKKDKKLIDSIKQQADNLSKTVDANKLTRARNNARSIFQRVTGDVQGDFPIQPLEPEKNPWGSKLEASSTDWKNMTAEQLVNRRKQMKDFVNAIQTDSDVKTVLAEDQALAAAIKKGMASDMRTVIEWYNDQRLKIQDELHARHLTNTGDWMDPKKQRGAHKQFRDEMDAYLHELDAYYTERKTRIEEAGTDEGLTEAEIKNRTLNNEMEWQQRRAELQKLYSRKQKEVTEEELNAIYHIIAERTGDSENFVKAQIAKTNQFVDSIEKSGEKGAAIVHRWMSQVELDTERSYLKGQQALTKQMRAIEAIIDKERPFNGITKSLQESLSTMDILTGEMRKEYNELMKQGKDMTDFNNRQAQEEMKRTAFLLGEAENAYSTTIDHVMDDMRQKGMTAWADWLSADPKLQEALMAQLRSTYDAIQDAIKKEASQLKKQAEIMWNNILMPDGKTTLKDAADRAIAQLSLNEGRVSRANSLIGAGQASERVADKLAIKQMQLQLTMQEHYYNLMKLRGQAAVDMLNAQAKAARERHDYEEATRKELDAQHAQQALNLATAKEETELAKQREEIVARTEDSQNRLYKELREWASLLSSSIQGVFEASHAGDAEYYNELAKMRLTGKGGPGAGTYVVIDNEGTEDATAHYEYLNERQALERQHEIEIENARAEAWRKLMDDINMKFSETITDQLNAMLQNQAIDANTAAVIANTQAIYASMGAASPGDMGVGEDGVPNALRRPEETSGDVSVPKAPWQMTDEEMAKGQGNIQKMWNSYTESGISSMQTMNEAASEMPGSITPPWQISEEGMETGIEKMKTMYNAQADAHGEATNRIITDEQARAKATGDAGKQEVKSTKSSFAAMTAAANMYGIAYQTMANDNLDTTQKVEMMIVQAAGQAAISMLTASMAASTGETAANAPSWISKTLKELGPIGGPVAVGVFTALIGGLMGLATSKIAKSKSQIAQVTGASVGAGRLATGMLTYAEGNVNEFSNPDSLTVGRSYNVDGADGKTYRAKYMGKDAKTHITNGPEFHLVGEKGREAIIDAHTTRNIQLNEPEIWGAIKTLYNGGSLRHTGTRRGRGVRNFAEGNVEEFEDVMADGGGMMAGGVDIAAMTEAMNRQAAVQEALLERLNEPIYARNILYGAEGLPAVLQKLAQEAARHGEKYL